MQPACTSGAGTATNGPPDTCKTPPYATPVAYPNIGTLAQSVGFSTKVTFSAKPALMLTSQMPMSSGDEAGTLGGVVSGTFMGPVQFSQGSSKVMVEGKPCEMLTAMTRHNQSNTIGQVAVLSQESVLVMP